MNDERLARRAAAGDERAFTAIYERYQGDLYRFCLAIVGNGPDAQEALQNTMVQALRSLPGEERKVALKPWLYRVARNEAINVIRERRETTQLEPERIAAGPGLATEAETRDRLRRLLEDLSQLPERQRAALVMRELSGLGFAEIGSAFDTSDAVARQTVYEARLGLREMEGGREMSCEEVKRAVSEADGRVLRRRDIRAHLRGCEDCRRFREAIAERRGELAGIAPLPAAASAAVLHAVLGGGGGGGATAAGIGGAGSIAGKAVATSTVAKSLAAVALVAAGAGAADRAGLVDTPIPGGGSSAHSSSGPSGTNPGDVEGGATGVGGASGLEGKTDRSGAGEKNDGHDSRSDARGPGGDQDGQGSGGSGADGVEGNNDSGPGSAHGQETAESHGGGRANAHTHAGGHSQGSDHANDGEGSKSQGTEHSSGHESHPVAPESGGQQGNGSGGASHPSHPPADEPPVEVAPDKQPTPPLKPPKSQSNQGGAEGERPQG